MIKVMIADDQNIMLDGLETILHTTDDIRVIHKANNGLEASSIIETHVPDILLMDIRMPIMDGVEATKIIKERYPEVKIIILTTFDDDNYIIDALSYGATGYLLKDIDGPHLIQAVREAYNGNLLLPGPIAMKLANNINNQKNSANNGTDNIQTIEFTKRELDIARQLLAGKTNKEIAETLFLTIGTVKNYITSIYNKLGVTDRVEAVLLLQKYDV